MASGRYGFGNSKSILYHLLILGFLLPLGVVYFQFTLLQTLYFCIIVQINAYVIFVVIPLNSSGGGKRQQGNKKNEYVHKFVLETISFSHFCESLRFTLDLLDIKFEEEHNLGILGVLFAGRSVPVLHYFTKKKGKIPATTRLGDSRHALRFLYGYKPCEFLRTTKERLEIEERLHVMGHAIQAWAYTSMLTDTSVDKKLVKRGWGVECNLVPHWQRILGTVLFPILRVFMIKALRLNPKTQNSCWIKIENTFEFVNNRLKEQKSPYLDGDSLTFLDVTFASLAAIMWVEKGYSGIAEVVKSCMWKFEELPADIQDQLNSLRSKYPLATDLVSRVYKKHRFNARVELYDD